MKKLLTIFIFCVTLFGLDISTKNMYQRFILMEEEMKSLKQELETLKKKKTMTIVNKEDSNEDEEVDNDEDDLEGTLDFFDSKIIKLTKATNGNHLKFGADYRFALDNINYTMADKSEASNNMFMTNRFWMNMFYKANNNLSFQAQLAYQKAFGARSGASPTPSDSAYNQYETFDWITNENAYDGIVRLKNVYFFYKNDTFASFDMPWTFSIGRRPSTNGHLINFRDDDHTSSPMAHTVNVEFDGLSSKFTLNKDLGTYIKFCAGRGMTNADVKFTSTPYAETNDIPNIDLVGLILVPYSDGQYSLNTQYYFANNLIDMTDTNTSNKSLGFDTVGDMHSFTANFIMHGIGSDISEFLDDTTFFISGAFTKSDPKDGKNMIGSTESETGYSYWLGTQFPSLISDKGKWGIEYNHGSQYFRSITYAEDTNIGSKVATRGDAYEVYFTEYLVDKYLSMQVRYTYIDYEYTGSNGFFGGTSGNAIKISDIPASSPMASQVVDKAQDIRFYIRYRY